MVAKVKAAAAANEKKMTAQRSTWDAQNRDIISLVLIPSLPLRAYGLANQM